MLDTAPIGSARSSREPYRVPSANYLDGTTDTAQTARVPRAKDRGIDDPMLVRYGAWQEPERYGGHRRSDKPEGE